MRAARGRGRHLSLPSALCPHLSCSGCFSGLSALSSAPTQALLGRLGGTGIPPEPRAALSLSCSLLRIAGSGCDGMGGGWCSRAATAFISIQVLRSYKLDVSVAINLMKPTK